MKQTTCEIKWKRNLLIFALVLSLLLSACGEQKSYRTIRISELLGIVTAEDNGSAYEAYSDMHLREGHALTTDTDSYARMVLDDSKYVKLEEDSRAAFKALGKSGSKKTVIDLERGVLTNELTQPLAPDESYVVNTPNAVLAVRGTFFRVEVNPQANGDILTDIYTYGGEVQCSRILPDGKTVEEQVIISGGYKTTVSMDTEETIYVIEEIVPDKENVEPIWIDDISEDDLVDMYVASTDGHELFISTDEIWQHIESRNIDVTNHISAHDQTPVEPPVTKAVPQQQVPVVEAAPAPEKTAEEQPKPEEPEILPVPEQSSAAEPIQETPPAAVTLPEVVTPTVETPVVAEPAPEEIIENEVPPQQDSSDSEDDSDDESDDSDDNSDDDSDTSVGGGGGGGGATTPHTHTEVTETTDATCLSAGKIITKCSSCNEVLNTEVIPALNHPELTESYTAATCTEDGKRVSSCKICGEILDTEFLFKTGHTEKEIVAIPSDCGNAGRIDIVCETCGVDIRSEPIPATGEHTEVSSTTATCTSDGIKTVSCSVCNTVISETEDPMLGHSLNGYTCDFCGGIEIGNDQTFSDTNFRTFVETFDTNGDNFLQPDERENVTSITLTDSSANRNITTLKGIEYFPELESLIIENGAALNTLDITQNTKLRTLHIAESSLQTIDLSGNINLQELSLERNNWLSATPDLSMNTDLVSLNLISNNLPDLNLNANTNLQTLTLEESVISLLKLTNCSDLETLSVSCPQLTVFDIGAATNLNSFTFFKSNITDFSFLSGCTELEEVSITENTIETWVDPTALKAALVKLNTCTLSSALSTELSFSGNTSLEELWVHNMTIGTLDLSDCSQFSTLITNQFSAPEISVIDLRNNGEFTEAIDLTSVENLTTVYTNGTANAEQYISVTGDFNTIVDTSTPKS